MLPFGLLLRSGVLLPKVLVVRQGYHLRVVHLAVGWTLRALARCGAARAVLLRGHELDAIGRTLSVRVAASAIVGEG